MVFDLRTQLARLRVGYQQARVGVTPAMVGGSLVGRWRGWFTFHRYGGQGSRDVAKRWYQPIAFGLTVVILLVAGVVFWLAYSKAASLGRIGADLTLYVEATRAWLEGASFYPAHQLAGTHTITDGDILYPPSTIPLFVAFLVLPSILFWAMPLAVIGWALVRLRPAPWSWPLMALCLAYPPTMVKIVHANPFMWAAAAVALGMLYRWPAVFALLKPSLAPFALIGVRHKAWWMIALGVSLASLPLLPMWFDYLRVLTNSQNPDGLLYSVRDIPLMAIPILARLGRRPPISERVGQVVGLDSEFERRLRIGLPAFPELTLHERAR